MLDEEVIAAVREGNFHIWPIATIEEGMEILTAQTAGRRQEDGSYPEGTLFRKVDDRLRQISDIVHKYGKEMENGTKSMREESIAGVPAGPSGAAGSGGNL
jgi:predicted ATP-dependent protease